ncbi:amidohydrolase [Dethiosulfovibrio peptidovorans DSM 11002]|uniref:Amidohydrolase n=1 Tax=Dethiosulfovibrio peptidovorans DSM 11002 TaxID=469381 RepID=D2Z792_9BACT|nr:amidohydrolase [Dethiosulfovibrio peptidovorans]EFC91339.1 amidohydrolase [Dethiosulfovibrio peptidovorans DSM 11002]
MKAIVNATVITVSGEDLVGSTVILKDGKIQSVGATEIPYGTEIIDGMGKFLSPGLIDAHTHLGVSTEGSPAEFYDHNDRSSSVLPELRIVDSLYPGDPGFEEARMGGVTTVQSLPGSADVVGGTGAVIKTVGNVVDRMIVVAPSSMKAALGENPIRTFQGKNGLPSTRMGCAACLRKALADAQSYILDRSDKEADSKPFKRDLAMEQMALVIEGKIPLSVHAHRADDICTAIRVAEEFKVPYTIEHCTEGHLIKDFLAEKSVKAAIGPLNTSRRKMELANRSWELPITLEKQGVHFCIITDHPVIPISDLILETSLAVRAGLGIKTAMRAITLSAAEHLGIDHMVGSIEEGKDGDLVLWSGHPLEFNSKVEMTFIDGKTVYSRE